MEGARASTVLAEAAMRAPPPDCNELEAARRREERVRKASSPEYAFVNFPKIRDPGEFRGEFRLVRTLRFLDVTFCPPASHRLLLLLARAYAPACAR